ncbi:ribonuclease P protein subunit p21 [Scaptodrosophila lebanonensis]|uniref:Ribonuclease P protein subunit p21 n=1 Tax=Drosophila lebanonensis TaxID=7225 RepID=A0A6J2U0X7_DROLE|nr:ribonuclease P protein subunit p21 [Scaptodrosophila lebanonensis]
MAKNKRKVFGQRHVCSRMNFLYQAANLMAQNNNNTLAAYYGKLCRNVGTKAVMHIAPAVKRTLCKRCSLPLLPGVNTALVVEQEHEVPSTAKAGGKRRNRRRRRRRRGKPAKGQANAEASGSRSGSEQKSTTIDDNATLQLQCGLCQKQRRFCVDAEKECWLERPEALAQVITMNARQGVAALHRDSYSCDKPTADH